MANAMQQLGSSMKEKSVTFEKGNVASSSDDSNVREKPEDCNRNGADIEQAKPLRDGTEPTSSQEEDGSTSSSRHSLGRLDALTSPLVLALLILILGMGTAAAFLGIGIGGAKQAVEDDFTRKAADTINKIEDAFEDYVNAASVVHNRCRHRNFTRQDFRELYEYLIDSKIQFKAVQFDPNITHDERPAAEAEARAYYTENHPHVDYQGFRGFNTLNSTKLEPRTNQSFYFPIHYMEPIPGNEAAIDLDYHSSESRIRAVTALFDHKMPSLTDRLSLVRQAGQTSRCGTPLGIPSYGVVLMHPGVNLTTQPDIWPKDFSSIVLCIPDLLRRSTQDHGQSSIVYIHDLSHPRQEAVFMGGVMVITDKDGAAPELEFTQEVELEDLNAKSHRLKAQEDLVVANRVWTVTVIAVDGTYEPSLAYVIVGGVIICIASIFLAVWVYTNSRRITRYNHLKAQSEAEKASLILENAMRATKAERELNDFIAHEVRNPVAAAMAATSFIKVAINKDPPLQEQESIDLAREDVTIVDNALHFVNDLLRNMLDMHRASNKQLQVVMSATDLLHDVLEPVGGMLHQRGNSKVRLIIECPPDLFIMTDALRLKQVLINLGRNSCKFIDEGFIRLKAVIVDGCVQLYVDDSGSGIPVEKRQRLFAKYQESLDMLNQGTGIGLFLCRTLVELMGGEIHLDDDYNSGVPGHPGTRFVVNLRAEPLKHSCLIENSTKELDEMMSAVDDVGVGARTATTVEELSSLPSDLPESLSVLFVDDDPILRKLFSRSLRRVCPKWTVREASNGETAIRLVEGGEIFDLIFVDMYMASVEKQLLGTETVAALREVEGMTARLCGLSANDKEQEFYEAGADAFMFKPFPCEAYAMTQELCRVLYMDQGKVVMPDV